MQLTSCVEESPTAAQVLDLDNESGLKSETIKGDSLAWKKMPMYLIKLSLENPFLFDYVKYEVQRAEIDYSASSQYKWVLWEGKNYSPELKRLGCLSGLMEQCVHFGSIKQNLSKDP